jgi:hypothetical protein
VFSCAQITPSIGRNLTQWNYTASKDLFGVRKAPYWDTIFVESAMPPLTLSSGDLLFFHDSMGVRFVQQGLMNSFLSGLFVFVPSLCWQEHCFSCEFSRKEKGRIVSRSGMERHGGLPARLGAPASAHNLPAARADCAASCRHDRAPTCTCMPCACVSDDVETAVVVGHPCRWSFRAKTRQWFWRAPACHLCHMSSNGRRVALGATLVTHPAFRIWAAATRLTRRMSSGCTLEVRGKT